MRLQQGFAEDAIMSADKGEVKVIVASGRVKLTEEKPEQYKVSTEIDGFKFPPSGRFFSKGKEDILEILKTASDNGYEMILRYEKVRKKEIDNNIPIEELTVDMGKARDSIFKAFAGIYNIQKNEWISFGEINPSDDTEALKQVVKSALAGSRENLNSNSFFGTEEGSKEVNNQCSSNIIYGNMNEEDRLSYLLKAFFFVKSCEDKYGMNIKSNAARAKVAEELISLVDNAYKFVEKEESVNYNSFRYKYLYEAMIKYEEVMENLNEENLSNMKIWKANFAKLIGELNK